MTNNDELVAKLETLDKRAREINSRGHSLSLLKDSVGPHVKRAKEQYAADVKELENIEQQKEQIFKQLQQSGEWIDTKPEGAQRYTSRYDPWTKKDQYKVLDVNEKQAELPPAFIDLSKKEDESLSVNVSKLPREKLGQYKKSLETLGSTMIRKIKEHQTAKVPASTVRSMPKSQVPAYWQNSKINEMSIITPAFQRFLSPYSNLDVKLTVPENDHNGIFMHESVSYVPQPTLQYANELLKINRKLKEVEQLESKYKQTVETIEKEAAVKENRESTTIEGYKKFVELFELAGIHADDAVWERSVGEPILQELTPLMSKIIAYGRQNGRFLNEPIVKEIMQK